MSDCCVGHLKDFPGTHLFFHRSKSINGAYFALWIETGKMFSHGNRPGIDKMSDIQSEKKLWARGKRDVGRACKGNLGARQRELQNCIPSSECRVSLRTCGCRRPATPRLEGNSSGEKRLCSHSLGRFVDWLVRALHLDRYRVRPGCGRGQRPPRSPWWYEAMRPPALSNRLRRPGCVHPPQLGQRLRRKLCHVLRNTRRPRGIVASDSPIDHIPRRTLLLLQKCAGRLPKNLFLNQV